MFVKDKLVLIIGASSGIGAAAAKAMAKAEGRVVLLARSKDLLDRVAAKITSVGGIARIYPIDLADAEAVAAVAKQISEELGTPDIIVNNAGAGKWLFVDETTPAQAVQMMAVPYFAAFNVTHAFLPAIHQKKQRPFRLYQFRWIAFCMARGHRLHCGALGGARLFRSLAGGPGWDGNRRYPVRKRSCDVTLLGTQPRQP
jgi:NAD(P)-dependent dehydrogenase (short-subunit alcohol dehydrogenase family)